MDDDEEEVVVVEAAAATIDNDNDDRDASFVRGLEESEVDSALGWPDTMGDARRGQARPAAARSADIARRLKKKRERARKRESERYEKRISLDGRRRCLEIRCPSWARQICSSAPPEGQQAQRERPRRHLCRSRRR